MAQLPDPPESGEEFATHSIRTPGSRTAVVAAAAIVLFVAAAVLKPWSAAPGGPSPSHEPTRTAAPSATGIARVGAPAGNACAAGAVLVSPGGERPPAIDLPPIPLARTGRVALVVAGTLDTNVGGTHDLVLVASATGARAVATVMLGGGFPGSGWAEVRSWSPDGSALLVAAGHSASEPAGNCSDLFLVQADGTRVVRLTDNGPGQVVVGGVFLSGGRSVAFIESDVARRSRPAADLRIAPIGSPPTTYWEVPCRLPADAAAAPLAILAAPRDGSRLGLRCAGGATVFDPATRRSTQLFPTAGATAPIAVGWSAEGRIVLALEDSAGAGARPLEVRRANAVTVATAAKTAGTRVESWDAAAGHAAFAPEGSRVVAQACVVTGIPYNCQQDLFSIDVATGAATLIYARQPMLVATQVRWLPDGSRVVIPGDGGGSLYLRPDRLAAPIKSTLPADAVWWSPSGK